jgi:hypothetical protein
MFDRSAAAPLSATALRAARTHLGAHDGADLDESELLDHLTELELLKSAAAAAQARITAALARKRWCREEGAGVPAAERCRGLSAEVALARQESPVRGARSLGLAKALVHEMPRTLAALSGGVISEWRATLLVRETAVLTREDRSRVDEELAGRLATLGDRKVAAMARAIGYRLDPGSAVRRIRGATSDRYVSVRPAPDTMTYLTGFLPVAEGIACHVALQREADTLRARGDERTRGQIMADTLVARVTGREPATGATVEIQLVMTDAALLQGSPASAELRGYGPVPAPAARELVRNAATAWVRRLYAHPDEGTLVAMDSRRRLFDGQLRAFVVARDQTCRTPWCDALIRHADHVDRATDGGATSADNGEGLCEACNYTKERPGWSTTRRPGVRHRVAVTTPTGRVYETVAPHLTG